MFTADEFGFGDDESRPENNAQGVDEQQDEMPDTLNNLRNAVLTPPPGLYGGDPSSIEDPDWNLFYEDTPMPPRQGTTRQNVDPEAGGNDDDDNDDVVMADENCSPELPRRTPKSGCNYFLCSIKHLIGNS